MREQIVCVRELKKSASNNYLKEFEMREIQKSNLKPLGGSANPWVPQSARGTHEKSRVGQG